MNMLLISISLLIGDLMCSSLEKESSNSSLTCLIQPTQLIKHTGGQ